MTNSRREGWGKDGQEGPGREGGAENGGERAKKKELVSRATTAIRGFVAAESGWEESTGERVPPVPSKAETMKEGGGLWKDGRRRERLPIDERLPTIHDLLERNQLVIVEAPTGTGKTTRIAQYELVATPERSIILTQPRRNAVRWNGRRIASEMGDQPGGVVGWRLAGEDPTVSLKTRLTLTIDQSLINRIRKSGGRLPGGTIIIDEAHERSISIDLLLGLIKEGLASSPGTKVLITSATIDAKRFSAFFGDAPVESVSARSFPVSTEPVRLGTYEHHAQGAARAARTVMERFKRGELAIPTLDGSGTQNVPRGTVLVLLPGKDDIREVMRSIQGSARELGIEDRVEVLAAHGESTPEEQDRAQAHLESGKLRFVCGTEVLRSSVTVTQTVGVIDSLQVKRFVSDANGVGHLGKIAVSRAEADQGKGRAGRTQPGFYMPVVFGQEYERLDPYPTPAILQQPITNVVLQVAAVGRSARDFAFIDKPPADKLDVALDRLKRIGALDNEERITKTGELLVQFPLDPERAKVLLVAEKLGVLPEAVVVTGILEAENIFFQPNREQESVMIEEDSVREVLSHFEMSSDYGYWRSLATPRDPATVDLDALPEWIQKEGQYWKVDASNSRFPSGDGLRWLSGFIRKRWAGESKSDFVAMVRAYRAFKGEEQRLKRANPPKGLKESPAAWRRRSLQEWCERNFVNQKRLRMAERTMHEIVDELGSSPLKIEHHIAEDRPFDPDALGKALISGLIDNVAKETYQGFSGPIVESGRSFQIGRESACPPNSNLVIVGGVRKVPTRRQGFFFLADMAAPVKKEWLREMMPQLCVDKRQADAAYDPIADAVLETEISYYGVLEIGRERVQAPYTQENVRKFAQWLASREAAFVSNERLKKIVLENMAQQQRAKELNQRAGEPRFRVLSMEELATFYVDSLRGAWKLSEIEDPEALRLPPLENTLVEKTLLSYPDSISVLGSQVPVEYSSQYQARGASGESIYSTSAQVSLGDCSEGNRWLDLPDGGVALPGGLPVWIKLSVGWRSFTGQDIPQLKEEIMAHLNRSQWERWNSRPSIPTPDIEDENASIPEISTATYGANVVDQSPLLAYGTLVASGYSGVWQFTPRWFQTLAEAERFRADSVGKLNTIIAEKHEQKEYQRLLPVAKELQAEISAAYTEARYSYDAPEHELRDLIYKFAAGYLPSRSRELGKWIDDGRSALQQFRAGVLEAKERVGREKAVAEERRVREASQIPDPVPLAYWDDEEPYPVTQEPPGQFGDNAFARFFGGQAGDGPGGKRNEEQVGSESVSSAEVPRAEREVMSDELRTRLLADLADAKFFLSDTKGLPEGKKIDSSTERKVARVKSRVVEARKYLSATEREIRDTENAARARGQVSDILRRSERLAKEAAQLRGEGPGWTERYRELMPRMMEIARAQGIELEGPTLESVRSGIAEFARRNGNSGDTDAELEEILIDAL